MFIYYTDYHSVDEDLTAILAGLGGNWHDQSKAGIAARLLDDSPTNTTLDAASRCRHPKLIKYYTDWHDVDEESMTEVNYGGMWDFYDTAGFMRRNLSDPINSVYVSFASRKYSLHNEDIHLSSYYFSDDVL